MVMVATDRKEHWEWVYSTKGETGVSWYQREPRLSLELSERSLRLPVVESSTLAAEPLGLSIGCLTFPSRKSPSSTFPKPPWAKPGRGGAHAGRVEWIAADITEAPDVGTFEVWHDRAVFHFLTDAADRRKYVELALRTVPTGGYLIIATFADEGPPRCSGLDVCRYNANSLSQQSAKASRLCEKSGRRTQRPGSRRNSSSTACSGGRTSDTVSRSPLTPRAVSEWAELLPLPTA